MYCSGCEATVRSVLTGLDGVTHAEADNTTETATVTYDPTRVSPQQMVQAINTNTYYQASLFDGPVPTASSQNEASSALWAVVATLAAALAASVLLLRRAKRAR
jgi:copper chaperone CopZ